MYYIGIDLGKKQDPTAVALVAKRVPHPVYGTTTGSAALTVIGLERVPLGTPYLDVVERVRELTSWAEFQGRCSVAVDATGVGTPVVEALRKAVTRCEVNGVTITGGEHGSQRGMDFTLPKHELISDLQLLFEKGDLGIAAGIPDALALKKELLNVRATPRGAGRVRIGADKYGEHDDLVIAVALACWRSKRKAIGWGEGRLPGI